MIGPIDEIVPVDLYIMGCPPRPQTIVGALSDALGLNIEGIESLLETPEGFRGEPVVDPAKCIGCAACMHSCPAGAIAIDNTGADLVVKFTHKDCICCATCEEVCPTGAKSISCGLPTRKRLSQRLPLACSSARCAGRLSLHPGR